MEILIFAVVLLLSLLLIPLGLPGLWLMIGAALGYNALVAGDPIGWFAIGGSLVLAVIAEVLEFTLSARYTQKYGGSRRAAWGAILGGIAGAIVGVPVPVIGSVIGAFIGSFAGALVAEYTRREATAGTATKVATGALIGRVVAAAMKTTIGVAIAAWLVAAAVV
ncbi:MAG TPA: DUF456 domain-containing protein [Gemmatimonadaceae bacterium]|jgi:uncharacterized protein YqgC (DUF456 family)|nr:DUF456 domain-containing protein [Gemmatimonadaceae bacterium]